MGGSEGGARALPFAAEDGASWGVFGGGIAVGSGGGEAVGSLVLGC